VENAAEFKLVLLEWKVVMLKRRDQVRAFFSEMLDDAADNFDILVGVDFRPSPKPPVDPGHLPPMLT
jgi:hypothetical protein